MSIKNEVRKCYIEKRENESIFSLTENNKTITNQIINWDIFRDAESIMSYSSIRNEVDLLELHKFILNNKNTLLLPRCIEKYTLEIYKIKDLEKDLRIGKYDIKEPYKTENLFLKKDIDIILVPGVAFGREGGRIGFGAGYYDRFLKTLNKSSVFVGIAYNFQIVEDLILDKYDVMMDYIITEKEVIKTNGKRK